MSSMSGDAALLPAGDVRPRPEIIPLLGDLRSFEKITAAIAKEPFKHARNINKNDWNLRVDLGQLYVDNPYDKIPDLPRNEYGLESLHELYQAYRRVEQGLPPFEEAMEREESVKICGLEIKYSKQPGVPDSDSECTDSDIEPEVLRHHSEAQSSEIEPVDLTEPRLPDVSPISTRRSLQPRQSIPKISPEDEGQTLEMERCVEPGESTLRMTLEEEGQTLELENAGSADLGVHDVSPTSNWRKGDPRKGILKAHQETEARYSKRRSSAPGLLPLQPAEESNGARNVIHFRETIAAVINTERSKADEDEEDNTDAGKELVFGYASTVSPGSRRVSCVSSVGTLKSRRVSIDVGVQPEIAPADVVPDADALQAARRRSSIGIQERRKSSGERDRLAGFEGLRREKNGVLTCEVDGRKFELVVEDCSHQSDGTRGVQCSAADIDAAMDILFARFEDIPDNGIEKAKVDVAVQWTAAYNEETVIGNVQPNADAQLQSSLLDRVGVETERNCCKCIEAPVAEAVDSTSASVAYSTAAEDIAAVPKHVEERQARVNLKPSDTPVAKSDLTSSDNPVAEVNFKSSDSSVEVVSPAGAVKSIGEHSSRLEKLEQQKDGETGTEAAPALLQENPNGHIPLVAAEQETDTASIIVEEITPDGEIQLMAAPLSPGAGIALHGVETTSKMKTACSDALLDEEEEDDDDNNNDFHFPGVEAPDEACSGEDDADTHEMIAEDDESAMNVMHVETVVGIDVPQGALISPAPLQRTTVVMSAGVDIEPKEASPKRSRKPKKTKQSNKATETKNTRGAKRPVKSQNELKRLGLTTLHVPPVEEDSEEDLDGIRPRRSKRRRFPPLQYWKNEKKVYHRRMSQIMPTISEVIVAVDEKSDGESGISWADLQARKVLASRR